MKKNICGILKYSEEKTVFAKKKVDETIEIFLKQGKKINFNNIAKESGASKSFLYNNQEIKNKINSLKNEKRKEKVCIINNVDYLKRMKKEVEILKIENEELKKEVEILRGELYKLI